jgi:hypothetical protein
MKNLIIKSFIVITFLLCFFNISFGRGKSGCCSHHGGVIKCNGKNYICRDGTRSGCRCGSDETTTVKNKIKKHKKTKPTEEIN